MLMHILKLMARGSPREIRRCMSGGHGSDHDYEEAMVKMMIVKQVMMVVVMIMMTMTMLMAGVTLIEGKQEGKERFCPLKNHGIHDLQRLAAR